jgi:hypothetical protein
MFLFSKIILGQHQLSLIVNLTGKCEIDCSELPEKSKEIYEQLPNMVKADFNELFAECNPLGMLIHAHYY